MPGVRSGTGDVVLNGGGALVAGLDDFEVRPSPLFDRRYSEERTNGLGDPTLPADEFALIVGRNF